MPAKRKSTKSTASADHLHPSSAAASKTKPASGSSSASSVSTLNGNAHPASGKASARADAYARSGSTWNPIKLIERALFRTYWNIEATFVLSMLEAWEVFLVIVVFLVLTLLLWYSLIHYFPRHAQQVATRALYYVYGNSPPPQFAAVVSANSTQAAASAASQRAQQGVLEKLVASTNQLINNAQLDGNPELVDSLIANLNKLKASIANKPDL